MEEITQVVITAGITVATASIVAFSRVVAAWLKAQTDKFLATKTKEDTETIQTVANNTIHFVEKTYTDIHGPEKLQKAVDTAQSYLKEKGIEVTDDQLGTIIDGVLAEVQGVFAEDKK